MTFRDFLNKFRMPKKVFVDFETRGKFDPVNGGYYGDHYVKPVGRNPSPRPEPTREEYAVSIDFHAIQERDNEHLRKIIEKDESTDIKIQRLILWRLQKRFSELKNLLRWPDRLADRVASAKRGIDFHYERIERLEKTRKECSTLLKGKNMKTTITLTINGDQGIGKTTFVENIAPLLDAAARVTLKGPYDILLEESNVPNKAQQEEIERCVAIGTELDKLSRTESDRYHAMNKMVALLHDMGYCPREVEALKSMNESENHNTSCLIDKIRSDVIRG